MFAGTSRGVCAYSGEQDTYYSFDGKELTYNKITYLGHGGNGKVVLAEGSVPRWEYDELDRFQFSDVLLAVKDVVVSTSEVAQLSQKSFAFLQGLKHPNILRCHGLDLRELRNRPAHSAPLIKLITEYCPGGDLAQRMARETLTTAQIKHFLHEALSGLSFLHDKGIIHADIKCGNLFLQDDAIYPVLKIGDLDDPVRMTHSLTATADKSKFYGKGTRGHRSPEQLTMDVKVGRRTDVWSLGVAAIEMIRAKASNFWFVDSETQRRIEVVSTTTSEQINVFVFGGGVPEIPPETDSDLRDVFAHCFERDPAARATSAELLKLCDSKNFSRSRDLANWSPVEFVQGPLTEAELRKITETGCYSQAPVSWLDNSTFLLDGDAENQTKTVSNHDLLTFLVTEEYSLLYCMLLIQQANLRRPLHIVVQGPRTLANNQFEPVQEYIVALTLLGDSMGDFPTLFYLCFENLEILSYESCPSVELRTEICILRNLRSLLFHNSVIKKIDSDALDTLRGLDFICLTFSPTSYNPVKGDTFKTCLKRLVYEDNFADFRQLLTEKASLTTTRAIGELWKYRNCQSKAFLEDNNFLAKIKHGSVFNDGLLPMEIQLQLDGSTGQLLVYGCCTASMPVHPEIDVTAIQEVTCQPTGVKADAANITEFCERLFLVREKHPAYKKLISLAIETKPHSSATNFGNLAASIFRLIIDGWDAARSRDVARFNLLNLQELVFTRCAEVVLSCGDLDKFKDLRSVTFDHCTAVMIEDNVFAELEKLDHLTLDTPYHLPEHRTAGSDGNSHMKRFHFSPGYKWLRDYLSQHPGLVEAKTRKVVQFGGGFYATTERTEQENFMTNIKAGDLYM